MLKHASMSSIGTRIEETGTLLRDGDAIVLRRDAGGRWTLDMHRVNIELLDQRVRIQGVIVEDGIIDVMAIEPDTADT
jgi:Protein of unknown function (DUF5818)